MKIALCFLISYDHILHKEAIWKEWIQPNQDIIHVYFHYTDKKKIKSSWILEHCIPEENTVETSYYHMVDAYLALIYHAYYDDNANTWFCFLTESCVPIVSPDVFRLRFFQYADKTILSWKKAWWNTAFHKRANLRHLPEPMRLANDPWFIMTRRHADQFMRFRKYKPELYSLICSGGLANESIFAIVLFYYRELHNESLLRYSSTIANWERMTSATSPYVFKRGDKYEMDFIEQNMKRNPYAFFLRKVDSDFPDEILTRFYKKPNWKNQVLCFYYQYRILFYGVGLVLFFLNWILLAGIMDLLEV